MNKQLKMMVLSLVAVLMIALPAFAAGVQVIGKVKDDEGKPLTRADIVFFNKENGTKITFKTDDKGEYQRIGVPAMVYDVTISKEGVTLLTLGGIVVDFAKDPNEINFDFAAIREKQSQGQGLTPEQKKQVEDVEKKNAEIKKRNEIIKNLNAKLLQADQLEKTAAASTDPAVKQANYEQAVQIVKDVLSVDATKDLIWANLADAQMKLGDFSVKSDKDKAQALYADSANAYRKAIEINPAAKDIGGYHNNLGQALAKTGQPAEAVKEFTEAAVLDPTRAAQYYFNAGATLVNVSLHESDMETRQKDLTLANDMFDKAVATDPNYAEAYYQKGVNLMNQAKYDSTGKVIPVAGTVESFQKYLELVPSGPNAETAKMNIEFLGGKVQTGFKAAKSGKK